MTPTVETKSFEHNEGPWTTTGHYIYDRNDEEVAELTRARNSHLITAAPELYEALNLMVQDDAFAELCQTIGEAPEWLNMARLALAKASGGTR